MLFEDKESIIRHIPAHGNREGPLESSFHQQPHSQENNYFVALLRRGKIGEDLYLYPTRPMVR